MRFRSLKKLISLVIALVVSGTCLYNYFCEQAIWQVITGNNIESDTLAALDIPNYSGKAYSVVDKNKPSFTDEELQKAENAYIELSPLDGLGRCNVAIMSVCRSELPTTDRESIGMIKPSGWNTARYDDLIEDKYLFNRCHLLAYCLSGLNANEQNLITGTRYMNLSMEDFELQILDYVRQSDNHVLYRVTPVFAENELIARGVHMEAKSVEDDGKDLSFNVYCYNIQPGITIDYVTGESHRS